MNQIAPMEWLVNQIISLSATKSQLAAQIKELEETIHQSAEWENLQELKTSMQEIETKENSMRETAKNHMLEKDLKKIELLNGMTVQLDATPGALIIEDESKVPDEYWKEKTTRAVDKTKLKADIKEGVYVEWVSIEKDYKFKIISK